MPGIGLGLGLALTRRAGGSITAHVSFLPNALSDDDAVDTSVGTATISGSVTGTPTWLLSDDASGKYAIDSSTGEVTVADTLSAGVDIIVISVSGLTPSVSDRSFNISVTAAASGTAGEPIGLLLALTKSA